MVLWFDDGFMIVWFYSFMVLWFHGCMFYCLYLWFYGLIVLGFYGYKAVWFYDFMALWFWLYGFMVSKFTQNLHVMFSGRYWSHLIDFQDFITRIVGFFRR